MKLSKEQLIQAIAVVKSKIPQNKCPICGSEFGYREEIFYMFENGVNEKGANENKSPLFGGAALPLLVAECLNCSHLVTFNLVNLGVIKGD